MNEQEVLDATRRAINECAGGDPDRWFYANRFVFARLQLDERKTKTKIKRELLETADPSCGYSKCPSKRIAGKQGVHLHRIDANRGYARDNCVLMHADCHMKYHAEHPERVNAEPSREGERDTGEAILEKKSKCYEGQRFLYWWDISPSLLNRLDRYEVVAFIKKDGGERCYVPVPALKGYLTRQRQTSHGDGNWSVKVLKDKDDQLAFEPGVKGGKWLYLPVIWLHEEQED